MYLHGIPAYGRTYANDAEVIADWLAGKDFYVMPSVVTRGGYVNQEGLNPGDTINIYYDCEAQKQRICRPLTRETTPDELDEAMSDACDHVHVSWHVGRGECQECGRSLAFPFPDSEGE